MCAYSVHACRSSDVNLPTQMLKLIAKAGLESWPRLWHTLRASKATELSGEFPSHVCKAWMGHTDEVADKNHRMMTAELMGLAQGGTGGGDTTPRNGQKAVPLAVLILHFSSANAAFVGVDVTQEYPRLDSNQQPSASEADTLSS